MPNIVPGALWHPIDVGNRAARRKGRGLIGHIAVVNSTLLVPGPVSTRPSDWHFYLPKNPYPTGERFAQLIDLDLQCWSSGDANPTCAAFEAEGGVGADVNGPYTPNQVEGAAMILAHMHRTEGVPLQDMVNSLASSRGFGVHRYGIDPYRVAGGERWSKSYAKACPGDNRVKQIAQIVARAQQIVNGTGGFLMALSDAEQGELLSNSRQIRDYLGAQGGGNTKTENSLGYKVNDIQAALTHALPILLADAAKADGSDPQAVAAAVAAAVPAELAQQVVDLLGARIAGNTQQ